MSLDVAPAVQNEALMAKLANPEDRLEIQDEAIGYIRTIFREASFWRKILPPQPVTRQQLIPSVDSDTVEFSRSIEPESSGAMAFNFRSTTTAEYLRARRYRIQFFQIGTPLWEMTEAELYAQDYPLIKVVERNGVTDIAEVEDETGITHSDSCVALTGQLLDTPALLKLSKEVLSESFNLIDTVRKQTYVLLMASTTANDILSWQDPDLGAEKTSKILTDGYTYDQLLGKKLIVTTKTNIVPYGYVYLFVEPRYLGDFMILNSTRFYIDKVADIVRFKIWQLVGMGIGDVRGVARLRYGTAAA